MPKIGRNEPCPCGSGRKYKRCCGNRTIQSARGVQVRRPTQEEQRIIRRFEQMHDELEPLRLTSRPQIQAEFQGHKVRTVRNKLYFCPPDETFHDFLVNHLLWTLGESWFKEEMKKPALERHVILQWRHELYELVREAAREKEQSASPVVYVPTGNVKALLVLGDDVYQLQHALATPKSIIKRLRDRQQFQGARYEILAAGSESWQCPLFHLY